MISKLIVSCETKLYTVSCETNINSHCLSSTIIAFFKIVDKQLKITSAIRLISDQNQAVHDAEYQSAAAELMIKD